MFQFQNNQLYVEKIPVLNIVEKVKTPFYLYSQSKIEKNFNDFATACKKNLKKSLVCFAIKSNSNFAVLKVLATLGAGADIVSGYEMLLALKAGIPANKIVFSGVGKTEEELEMAVKFGIKQVNVESMEEALLLNEIALKHNKQINIALRANPDIDANTHDKITTGKKENKFGIAWEQAQTAFKTLSECKGIKVVGIDVHVGSQLTDLTPFEQVFDKTIEMVNALKNQGIILETIDVGGGLGVAYTSNDNPPNIDEYMALVNKKLGNLGAEIIFEPGRHIIADTGVLVSKIVRIKKTKEKDFVVLDAGMNDLIRPAMYDAYHEIVPVLQSENQAVYDIVGPICESSDVFAKQRTIDEVSDGQFVAIKMAGAYGATMGSNYNARPLCAEILVHNEEFATIRKEQTFEDIIRLNCLPDWL